ncbi:MAG: MaoC/PaaZ C-terminal domain-containing protein [Hyphomicrobium sp.]
MTALRIMHEEALDDGGLIWEDFTVGQVLTFGHCELSRESIIAFAREYDPQPFHIDEQAARLTMLTGLAASGWHVCTVFMGMLHDGLLSRCRFAGLYAIDEIKWRIPVRPGDQLACRVTCLGTNPQSGRPGHGLCNFHCEALNASGRTVMSWWLQLQFARRDGVGDSGVIFERKRRPSTVARLQGGQAIKFFEDVCPGDEIMLGSYAFSAERVVAFNKHYGSQPIHPDAAPDGLSTSGWHVTAICMQRLVRYYIREAQKLRAVGRPVPQLGPSPGIKHLHWHRPVNHADDILTFSCWAERKVEVTSKPGWGVLVAGIDVRNQHNECVVSFYPQLFLERRTKV